MLPVVALWWLCAEYSWAYVEMRIEILIRGGVFDIRRYLWFKARVNRHFRCVTLTIFKMSIQKEGSVSGYYRIINKPGRRRCGGHLRLSVRRPTSPLTFTTCVLSLRFTTPRNSHREKQFLAAVFYEGNRKSPIRQARGCVVKGRNIAEDVSEFGGCKFVSRPIGLTTHVSLT
ncbi:hypothetical protein J6590_044377 [Homalodisca vitripennis]|nr:hypothetical protein J6590_044377 [Homalodisca vitripennis]